MRRAREVPKFEALLDIGLTRVFTAANDNDPPQPPPAAHSRMPWLPWRTGVIATGIAAAA